MLENKKGGFTLLAYIRNALFIITLSLSFNTLAANWLLRIEDNSAISSSILADTIFTFSNGDKLYLLQAEQLNQINLTALFKDPGFHYLQADQALEQQTPQIQTRASAQSETTQDFLLHDGFTQLPQWQRDCEEITIAIIDSGVDIDHSQLQHITFDFPFDARLNESSITDEYGHGTHVAGLIAAQSDSNNNAQGACLNATVMPIRFLDRYGAGSVSDAIKSVNWAIANNAQIINHSWTVTNYSQALFDVLKEADQLGIIQVAAAGNLTASIEQSSIYPAALSTQLPGLITVANWDNENQNLYNSSNYGISSVDLAASGTDLISLAPDNEVKIRTGTSMAAPLVSAAAAMLKQQNSALNAPQIRSILQLSTQFEPQLNDRIRSSGRLNAAMALQQDTNISNLLFAQLESNFIHLNGIGFINENQWKYRMAMLPKQTIPLTVKSFSETKVSFVAQELVNGYWQLYRNGKLVNELAYQPILSPPSELQATINESGLLLAWRGSEMTQHYQVQAAIDDQGFITIAELDAPANQLQHQINNYETIRYRIKASYEYQFDGDEKRSEYSLYSEPLIVSAEDLANPSAAWQSEAIANLPQNSSAIIALNLTNTNSYGFYEVIEDPDNLILSLTSEGQLQIDTSKIISSAVTIAYNINGKQSIKTFIVAIHPDTNWSLDINNEEQLSLITNGFEIHSWQQFIDGTHQIDGSVTNSQALLSLNLDSVGRRFDTINVYDADELLTAEQLTINAQLVNINLPVLTNDNTNSKRLHVEFTLRDKNESTDSRCFIASAVYPDQPQKLHKLRTFRDQFLLQMPGGKTAVNSYYHYSPMLVEEFKDSPRIMRALKTTLDIFL